MEYVNLNRWLDAHEVSIDELGRDRVIDACLYALWDTLMEDALWNMMQNNPEEIVSELISEIAGLHPIDVYIFAEHLMREKNEDWRMFIEDDDGEFDGFYEQYEKEFKEWLKEHGHKVFDNDYDTMNYYLGEGIDTFLEFAYEFLGGKGMFDPANFPALFDRVDIYDFIDKYEDEFREYLEDNLENFYGEDWFTGWALGAFESSLKDYIRPDGYVPVWNYAYEFPSGEDVEILNEDMSGIGLIFFELDGCTYVALGTAGMSMMPALYYAYYIYSDLCIDPREVAEDIVRHGVGYYKYIIKEDRLAELANEIGYNIDKLDEISKEDYERFSTLLDKLSEEMKKGQISKLEGAIMGMAAYVHTPDVDSAQSH